MKGRCLCGATTYHLRANPVLMGFCYCDDCRYSSGAERTPFVLVPGDALEWTGERVRYRRLGESGGAISRVHCARCYSRLGAELELFPEVAVVYAGTLLEPENFKPCVAEFTASRVCWAAAPDELQQVEAAP